MEMAREDCTHFEFISLKRKSLKPSSFKLWRKRVNFGISQNHLKKSNHVINRFN